ncbi:MAG: hypothetical protein A2X88_07365 [Deltaproteobacteria bacterium GWC2_65_14]|nr:MAG: hypothetical protein A2X88_07365 [Deltaproteobacteria bacterium GWC2_65_14]
MLLALGVGGAWVGTLTAMEKYRPIWTAATLVFLGGVKDAKVTLDPPRAVVIYDPAKVGPERLTEATTRAGYPSTVLQEGGTLR